MRLQRIGLIFLAVYFIFIVGGYAQRVPEIRWFNHLFLTFIMGGWLLWRITKNRNLPISRLNLPIFAFLILGFATIPFSDSPRLALEHMWYPLIYAMLFFFIVNLFHIGQDKFVREVLFFITAVAIFLGALQLGSVFFGWGIVRASGQGWIEYIGRGIPLPWQADLRIFLPFGVSTQTAGFFASMIVITVSYGLSAKGSTRILLGILVLILATMLYFTYSRGGFVSVGVGLTVLTVLTLLKSERLHSVFTRRNLAIFAALIAVIAVLGVILLSLSSIGSRVSGDRVRRDLWRSATEIIIDHPITGVGTGLYGRALREYRDPSAADDRLGSAHNLYLNAAAENGIGVLIILAVAGFIIIVSWWRLRNDADTSSERWHLLNGMMAALAGFAVHNLFDTLTLPGTITLAIIIIVYVSIEPAQSRLYPIKEYSQRWIAGGFLIVVIGYGIWFVAIVDRAHAQFIASLDSANEQIALVQDAISIDPNLNLYHLHLAYLQGRDALANPSSDAQLQAAIEAHLNALELEPTWVDGMANLAALLDESGDFESAMDWMTRARDLAARGALDLQWARFAERSDDFDETETIEAYVTGIRLSRYLPLSNYWSETDLRLEAVRQYAAQQSEYRQYHIARVHYPDELEQLLTDNPTTAAQWWIIGEHALTVENDVESAIDAFSMAIDLNPANGDFYASRARAIGTSDLKQALDDLATARFLGTFAEYPNAIEAALVESDLRRLELLQAAVPPFFLSQGFDGVVFAGRTAQVIPYDGVRAIGRGEDALQPWYELATYYIENNDINAARNVYQLIRLHAPEDERVLEIIRVLDT